MKTAVIISGDARTFKDCYPSLDACILSQNDCDVFLHLYEDENTEEVLKTYKPQQFIVEKKGDVSFPVPSACETNKPPEVNAFGVMCQWRNVQIAFGMVCDEYDCVLKTRYDIKYTDGDYDARRCMATTTTTMFVKMMILVSYDAVMVPCAFQCCHVVVI